MTTHLTEGDYEKKFPESVDEFPSPINDEHFIDAWHLTSAYESLLAIEDYLIAYKANIETPLGEDVLGNDGELDVVIPAARYTGYEAATAWDSNLLEENIKLGETIFGIAGTLEVGGGAIAVAVPVVTALANGWVYAVPPTLTMDAGVPAVAAPEVSAA